MIIVRITPCPVFGYASVKGTLGGAELEKARTALDSIDLRVLGPSETGELPWTALLLFEETAR
jgi:hypothetical protein